MGRQEPCMACQGKRAETLPRVRPVDRLPDDAQPVAVQDGRGARPELETPESLAIEEGFRSPRRASIRALEELVAAHHIHR